MLCSCPAVNIPAGVALHDHGFIHIEAEIIQIAGTVRTHTLRRVLLFPRMKALMDEIVVCTPHGTVGDGTGYCDAAASPTRCCLPRCLDMLSTWGSHTDGSFRADISNQ